MAKNRQAQQMRENAARERQAAFDALPPAQKRAGYAVLALMLIGGALLLRAAFYSPQPAPAPPPAPTLQDIGSDRANELCLDAVYAQLRGEAGGPFSPQSSHRPGFYQGAWHDTGVVYGPTPAQGARERLKTYSCTVTGTGPADAQASVQLEKSLSRF